LRVLRINKELWEWTFLVDRFINRWKKKEKHSSFASKIREIGKPSRGLKKEIIAVVQRIDVQTRKLDNALKRFRKRDEVLFKRVIKSLSERDMMCANVLAGELTEIRKVEKMLMHAALALESVSLRLNTVSELGDVVTVLAPAAGVLDNIRSGMAGVLPQAGRELGNIGIVLTDIVASTNQNNTLPMNIETANDKTEEILKEAEIAADQKLKEQFTDVATEASMSKKTIVES
jgi:division protein CdvB (Snf7/Vps24/ESCRT-III family)